MNAILRFVALIRIWVLCLIQLIVRLTLVWELIDCYQFYTLLPFPNPHTLPLPFPHTLPPIPTPAPPSPPTLHSSGILGKYRQCSFRIGNLSALNPRKFNSRRQKKKRHFLWSQVNDLPQPPTYPQLNINSFNLPGSFLISKSKSKSKGFHWPGNFIIYYSNHVFSYHVHHSSSE